jgi:uncharacterized protein (UPF0333 family)
MKFLNDESGQGAAEYLLLFAGVIVIAIGALMIYSSYFTGQPFDSAADADATRTHTAANDRSL